MTNSTNCFRTVKDGSQTVMHGSETVITLFKEYCGLEIPSLQIPHQIIRDKDAMKPGSSTSKLIYQTNVKVFQKDSFLRKEIIEAFLKNGFILEADHITSVIHGNKTVIKAYDRLIFRSPLRENPLPGSP